MIAAMTLLDQSAAIDPDLMGPGDRARFFRAARHDRLEGLTASFRSHRYPLHSHETYVVGLIVAGCESYRLRGVRHYAGPGEICLVNPGEVHDGEPAGEGYAYRMTYPSEALLAAIAAEWSGVDAVAAPSFHSGVLRDPALADALLAAHRLLERAPDSLAGEEAMLRAYGALIERHADGRGPSAAPGHGAAVRRVAEFLESAIDRDPDLSEIAAVAGLSRHHLVRLFRRETGLTPHAYLTDARVRAARRRLAAGEAPADVAAACGFFDQSHLSRCFKARIGVAPGAFRRA